MFNNIFQHSRSYSRFWYLIKMNVDMVRAPHTTNLNLGPRPKTLPEIHSEDATNLQVDWNFLHRSAHGNFQSHLKNTNLQLIKQHTCRSLTTTGKRTIAALRRQWHSALQHSCAILPSTRLAHVVQQTLVQMAVHQIDVQ